eukprot:gb/GFBE01068277.1/.p1 GENE.gb/GFBE01068277.1/~~gb/GFBE01068277.1/.p1  ORF type:complete len:488 (+),score=92.10 gb/GFBE01068277.1/:1-1464(+)
MKSFFWLYHASQAAMLALGNKLGVAVQSVQRESIPKNLESLETSLLSMAKMGLTPGLEDFVVEVNKLTEQMKDELYDQMNITQNALDTAWDEFVACEFVADPGSLPERNETHRNRSERESFAYDLWMECMGYSETANQTRDLAHESMLFDCDQPVSCMYSEPIPQQSNLEYLQARADEFEGLHKTCANSEEVFYNATRRANEVWEQCQLLKQDYLEKRANATDAQHSLEQSACGDLSKGTCEDYTTCYTEKRKAWIEQNQTTYERSEDMKVEYRGIARIQCFLGALNESAINSSTDLDDELDVCRHTYYNESSMYTAFDPYYYPNLPDDPYPEFIACNATVARVMEPGGAKWIRAYYSNMPANTTYEECNASCCVEGTYEEMSSTKGCNDYDGAATAGYNGEYNGTGNLIGQDQDVADLQACQDACTAHADCHYYTYYSGTVWCSLWRSTCSLANQANEPSSYEYKETAVVDDSANAEIKDPTALAR